jgi:hypothetical protein
MALRKWGVRPDHYVDTAEGQLAAVSQDALVKALYDAAIILDRAGGVASVVVGRAPTGLPGEFVTTGAVVEWKDRTDAKAQPETKVTVQTEPTPLQLVDDYNPPAGVEVDERDVPPELREHA